MEIWSNSTSWYRAIFTQHSACPSAYPLRINQVVHFEFLPGLAKGGGILSRIAVEHQSQLINFLGRPLLVRKLEFRKYRRRVRSGKDLVVRVAGQRTFSVRRHYGVLGNIGPGGNSLRRVARRSRRFPKVDRAVPARCGRWDIALGTARSTLTQVFRSRFSPRRLTLAMRPPENITALMELAGV